MDWQNQKSIKKQCLLQVMLNLLPVLKEKMYPHWDMSLTILNNNQDYQRKKEKPNY